MAEEVETCQLLLWDTEFFGRRIARVNGDRLSETSAEAIEQWCEGHQVDALYFVARADDARTAEIAHQQSYHLVDIRMTFERESSASPSSPHKVSLRPAEPRDLSSLQQIARRSHTDTRFYFDSHFPREKCDELYAVWIESSLRKQTVTVAEHGGKVVAYVSKDEVAPSEGRIGLIAVDQGSRGLGIGQALVGEATTFFAQQGKNRVSVVTQGRNIAAQRLYGRCGFIARDLQLYYHRWFARGG